MARLDGLPSRAKNLLQRMSKVETIEVKVRKQSCGCEAYFTPEGKFHSLRAVCTEHMINPSFYVMRK